MHTLTQQRKDTASHHPLALRAAKGGPQLFQCFFVLICPLEVSVLFKGAEEEMTPLG